MFDGLPLWDVNFSFFSGRQGGRSPLAVVQQAKPSKAQKLDTVGATTVITNLDASFPVELCHAFFILCPTPSGPATCPDLYVCDSFVE